MLEFIKQLRKKIFKSRVVVMIVKGLLYSLLKTCRLNVKGIEQFCTQAHRKKCILMLWHNRLCIIPFVLSQYTTEFVYTALVSASRDGDFLSAFIQSYKNGKTIRVSHLSRHEALRASVRTIQEGNEILVMTPDGPRGPCYKAKPGIALAAIQTGALVFPVTWDSKKYWELKTWDRLRIPKPFSNINVTFDFPIHFDQEQNCAMSEALQILQDKLKS